MDIDLPCGTTWRVRGAKRKLEYRAQLPGAHVFDLVAQSLRKSKASGVSTADRLACALPASWLVNSPATSPVLRRWALAPHSDACLALIDLLEAGPAEWSRDPETPEAVRLGLAALGDEPTTTEALSKVLALVVPDAVPLMPLPARSFVLGEASANEPGAFWRMVDWFAHAVAAHAAELESTAREHRQVELTAAAVLDRLLWFDSEGHAHFPKID